MGKPLPPAECVRQLKLLRQEVAAAIHRGDESNLELFRARYQEITGRVSQ